MNEQVLVSVKGSKYKIIRPKGEYSYIQFLESGYICRAKNNLIKTGLVYDPTEFIREKSEWEECKLCFVNNKGQKFEAFSRKGKKIRVVFEETNYMAEVYIENARLGKVSDPTSASLYGVGIIGMPNRSLSYINQAKQLWNNMIKRCYCEKDVRGYFGKAFVDERWKTFENFLADISKLDGFDGWLSGSETGIKYNLDKDFYKDNNNTYSRYACCFLPESFNKSLGKKGKTSK